MPAISTDIAEQDAHWLHRTGERREVREGEVVITAGVAPQHLLVVLEGEFVVAARPGDPRPQPRLGPGRLLWERAYMQRKAPRRSVLAATDGVLLCIRPSDVDLRQCEDPEFGRRFLKLITEFALKHCENGTCPEAANGNGGVPHAPKPFRMPEVIEKLLRGDF